MKTSDFDTQQFEKLKRDGDFIAAPDESGSSMRGTTIEESRGNQSVGPPCAPGSRIITAQDSRYRPGYALENFIREAAALFMV